MRRRIEIDTVNDSLERRVGLSNLPKIRSELLTDFVRQSADHRPDRLVRIRGLEREVETDELLIVAQQLKCLCTRTNLLGYAVNLIIKDVAETLREHERKDEVLVLRGVLCATDRAGSTPKP